MNFAFSDEQEAFRDSLKRFFAARASSTEVRRWMDSREGYDPLVWSQMAHELGLQGLRVPEQHGGQGFGFLEQVIVLEEMGRVLFPSPYFSSVCLAADLIGEAGSEADRAELLPAIAEGTRLAALALTEPGAGPSLDEIRMPAEASGVGFRLSGSKSYVVDGHVADWLLVPARIGGSSELSLFVVDADAAGVKTELLHTLDATRKLARVDLESAPARLLGSEGQGGVALSRTLDRAAVCLAAEMAGAAARCLEMAVEYAKIRVQFGRPIGYFQAIKHKCAEVLLEVESARVAAHWAGWIAAENPSELPVAASLAKAYCGDAFQRAAQELIQVHGGIGFTWEHDAHLFFKRARAADVLLGDASFHRARLAGLLGL